MTIDPMYLIPPSEILSDYAITTEEFIQHGRVFLHEMLIGRSRLLPHERILELGCGPGRAARALTEYLSSQGSYEGLDIRPSVITFCKDAYVPHPTFHFTLADIHNSHYRPDGLHQQRDYVLPYIDEEFDLIFSVSLFTHLLASETNSYLKEIRRLLKLSGRLLSTFLLLTDETRANAASNKDSINFRFSYSHDDCMVLNPENPAQGVAYDESWVRTALARHGFRVSEITYGYWGGGRDVLGSQQDIVIAVPT